MISSKSPEMFSGLRANANIEGATSAIEHIVGDGTAFFDAMDDWLCDERWYRYQFNRYAESCSSFGSHEKPRIVVSGQWGRLFAAWLDIPTVLVLPGGLRHNDLPPLDMDLTGQTFVFLDNSCYKGRTRDKIRNRIEEAGGRLAYSFVLYDGSLTPIDQMEGLYRYHGV